MTLFPFSLSYLILTPGRVRLPGEPERKSSSPGPSSPTSARWSADFAGKAKASAASFNRRLSLGSNRISKMSKSPSELECLFDDDYVDVSRECD